MADEAPPDVPDQPQPPFAPEDGAYAAIVSEYVGFQRAGADPISAALITAAHLLLIGLVPGQAPHAEEAG